MKINHDTRQFEFETATCYLCDGKGEVNQSVLCPLYNKPVNKMPGRICPHCGSKNRYSHKSIGSKIVQCGVCDGKGETMEDKYCHPPVELLIEYFRDKLEVVTALENKTFNESYLGIGIVGGVTDYGRAWKIYQESKDNFIDLLWSDFSSRQALQYLNEDGKIASKLVAVVKPDGYTIYPR